MADGLSEMLRGNTLRWLLKDKKLRWGFAPCLYPKRKSLQGRDFPKKRAETFLLVGEAAGSDHIALRVHQAHEIHTRSHIVQFKLG